MSTSVLSSRSMPISFSIPQLTEKLKNEHGVNAMTMQLSNDKSVSTVLADTLGWDTVYAIRIPDANNAITAKKASPKTFKQTITDPDLDIEVSIEGDFGDWTIGTGGDGKNLHMKIPITKGTYKAKNKTYSLNNCYAVINVQLAYFPLEMSKELSEDGSTHDLKLKTSQTATDPIVSLISFIFPQDADRPASDALLQGTFRNWFNSNIQQFEHVFSTVNINLLAKELQWLKPTYTSYAYSDHLDPDKSFFAVLCMTDGRSGKGLTHALSPSAIAPGSRASFLISRSLFVEKSILPGIPIAFVDSTVNDFKMINGNTEIMNKDDVKLKMSPVRYGAIDYTPYAESFDITINNNEIVTKMKSHIEFSPGIDVYIYTTTYQTIELVNKPDGTQTIGYKETRPTESIHEVVTAMWVKITTFIISAIVAIVGVFVGNLVKEVVTKIIIAIIVVLIGALIALLLNVVLQVLAKGVAESMPPIDPMIKAATDPIVWPTATTQFKLTSAQLNGSVQFGGDPSFQL